jgi:hypothetical protein
MPTDQPHNAAHNPRSRFSLVIAFVGLAGVAAIFLPFAGQESPLSVVSRLPFLWPDPNDFFNLNELWPQGVPFLLAILVTLGSIRWFISGRLSRAERLVAYLAAVIAASCILSLYVPLAFSLFTGHGEADTEAPGFLGWFVFGFPLLGFAVGAYLLWRNSRTGVPATANAVAAMQVVYVVVAVFCLVAYYSLGWQVGAYFVAVTTLVYLIQIVAVSFAAKSQVGPTT